MKLTPSEIAAVVSVTPFFLAALAAVLLALKKGADGTGALSGAAPGPDAEREAPWPERALWCAGATLVFAALFYWRDPFGSYALWGDLHARCGADPAAAAFAGASRPLSACGARHIVAVFTFLVHGFVIAEVWALSARGMNAGVAAIALLVPTMDLWLWSEWGPTEPSVGPPLADLSVVAWLVGMVAAASLAAFASRWPRFRR